MRRFLLASAAAAIACGSPAFAQDNAERIAAAALEAAPVWDGHNDVPIQLRSRVGNVINDFDFRDTLDTASADHSAMHSDLIRLKQGGGRGAVVVRLCQCKLVAARSCSGYDRADRRHEAPHRALSRRYAARAERG